MYDRLIVDGGGVNVKIEKFTRHMDHLHVYDGVDMEYHGVVTTHKS